MKNAWIIECCAQKESKIISTLSRFSVLETETKAKLPTWFCGSFSVPKPWHDLRGKLPIGPLVGSTLWSMVGGQILKVLKAEAGNKSVMSKGKATPLSATMVGNFNALFIFNVFVFGCIWSQLQHAGSLLCHTASSFWHTHSSCVAQAPEHEGLSSCGTRA